MNRMITFASRLGAMLLLSFAALNASPVGIFAQHGDVGAVGIPGDVAYDAANQIYTLRASGANMWDGEDAFQFAWNRIKGDFILQARAEFVGKGVEDHRKVGLMVRTNLGASSMHANVSLHGDGLTSLQYRPAEGVNTEELQSELKGPDVLQLERKGDVITMSVAHFGEPYSSKQLKLALGEDVYVGVFLCSHKNDVSETAILKNVRLIRPIKDGFEPYRDYIGSDVELLEVESGLRQTIHHEADSIQGPNWMPDGKALVLNHNGRMLRLDLSTLKTQLIDTGAEQNCNNDHVVSFDGKLLGISSGDPSRVFTLPMGGGKPKLITPTGPSYLHGISPDKKTLVFTGERNGELDLYAVSAKGGKEKQLTTAKGLDDGSEFTRDGKWIYFCSTRTGRMQVWRMKPDGSRQTQITFDDFNNWFPHVSPDGKSIVFITYGPEIPADDHPFYKHVYLRKMALPKGKPTVIAYLYGGQGSFNVNSWSPDGKRMAFVSNTDVFPAVTSPDAKPAARLGLQLWSLRKDLEVDVTKGLDEVKSTGAYFVETHSTYGLKAAEFRHQLDEALLKVTSMHVDYERLQQDLPGVIAEAKVLGAEYVILPWLPEDTFTPELARKLAGELNAWGAELRKAGLKLGYHPHGYEFIPAEGGTAFDILAKATHPEDVCFELDVFWAAHGGADPIALLKQYPERFRLLHLKDLKKGAKIQAGSRETEATDDVPIGQGQLDIPMILEIAHRNGIAYAFIEDETDAPLKNIPLSLKYIEGLAR